MPFEFEVTEAVAGPNAIRPLDAIRVQLFVLCDDVTAGVDDDPTVDSACGPLVVVRPTDDPGAQRAGQAADQADISLSLEFGPNELRKDDDVVLTAGLLRPFSQ